MNSSVRVAFAIVAILCLYMLTGLVGCGGGESSEPVAIDATATPVMTVLVRDLVAQEIPRRVVMTGKTEPSRSVDLKAETVGKVIKIGDRRGARVKQGMVIAEIEMNDRLERLEQAKAALNQAQLQYEAALKLRDKDLNSESQVAQALATLKGTEQMVSAIQLDIRNTKVVVPFDGILQDRLVEEGDYLGIGDPVGRVIDTNPLVISGEATEFQIQHLAIGEHGQARLPDDRLIEGHIRYVAGEADSGSRTFRVELEVPNPDAVLRAGLTARMEIETERVPAYRISPGLVSVLDDGRFGVKIVNADNKVLFVEADIVQSEPDALWLGSLPDKIRLITVGQGFVRDGDEVKVEIEEAPAE